MVENIRAILDEPSQLLFDTSVGPNGSGFSPRRTAELTDIAVPPRRRGRPPQNADQVSEVQSLDRAMSLLELLSAEEGLSLSDVGRRAGLPISTVHRLLATLERRELVIHDDTTGLWAIGVGAFRIGSAYLRKRKLPEIARPILHALLKQADETVNLTMVDGSDVVCVAQAESHAAVRAFFRLGTRLPLHASGAAKSILAGSTPEMRAARFGKLGLERFTDKTHPDEAALEADLAEIAERGYAIDDEEHTVGMRCVAAAIFNEWHEPIGAVSISGPTSRMPPERIAELGGVAREAADRLTALYSGKSNTR